MYLHIGDEISINKNEIISILNIDYVKNTREFKSFCDKLKETNDLIYINNNKNRSCIITSKDNKTKAYITNININTLIKNINKI